MKVFLLMLILFYFLVPAQSNSDTEFHNNKDLYTEYFLNGVSEDLLSKAEHNVIRSVEKLGANNAFSLDSMDLLAHLYTSKKEFIKSNQIYEYLYKHYIENYGQFNHKVASVLSGKIENYIGLESDNDVILTYNEISEILFKIFNYNEYQDDLNSSIELIGDYTSYIENIYAFAADNSSVESAILASEISCNWKNGSLRRFMYNKKGGDSYENINYCKEDYLNSIIPEDTAYLDYIIFQESRLLRNQDEFRRPEMRVIVIVHKKGHHPKLIDLGLAKNIAILLSAMNYVYPNAQAIKLRPALLDNIRFASFSILLSPVMSYIEGMENVVISPDKFLHVFPFDSLNNYGTPVLENYNLEIKTNLISIKKDFEIENTKKILIIGGVDYNEDFRDSLDYNTSEEGVNDRVLARTSLKDSISRFSYLPGTLSEVNYISKIYNTDNAIIQKYTGPNANEKSIKSLFSNKNKPNIIHFATHGFYVGNNQITNDPFLLSGIALSGANRAFSRDKIDSDNDGILYAYEVKNLDLTGVDLVVLSACQTGQGDIDYYNGAIGLKTAFKISGVKNIIYTLWDVGDLSTREFMIYFYNRLSRNGLSKIAISLRETKKYFINHPKEAFRSPEVWAAFVLD